MIKIDSIGATDTFKWSDDNGDNWNGTNIPITGSTQGLSNGLEITFENITGHSINDEWNINMRGSLTDTSSGRAYGYLRINGDENEETTDDQADVIENGARISLDYSEYGRGDRNFKLDEISSSKYDDIEEWFYKENIGNKIIAQEPSFNLEHIHFVKGVIKRDSSLDGNAFYIDQNEDGFMTMVLRSQLHGTGSSYQKIITKSELIQSEGNNKLIFETEAKDALEDVYYEIGKTFEIENGFHKGDINQTITEDAQIELPFFNCFTWGNGFESIKIKDHFNSDMLTIHTRPSKPVDDYKQNQRIASLTYSRPYEQTLNYNGINEFNLSDLNFKDLDDKYGSIQAIKSDNNDLDVWQEDKVLKVLYKKSILYNSDGSTNVGKSDLPLGGVIPYAGDFGISTHPESLASYGNYRYWADAKNGIVLRKGQSGIEIISNFGMRNWFRNVFLNQLNQRVFGGIDNHTKQYVLSIQDIDLAEKKLTIVNIVEGDTDLDMTTYSSYNWMDKTNIYPFNGFGLSVTDQISLFEEKEGTIGTQKYPEKDSLVTMKALVSSSTTNYSAQLSYLISNVRYTQSDLETIKSLATVLTDVGDEIESVGRFNLTRNYNEKYLYLIWKYNYEDFIYYSEEISESIQKNDCAGTLIGKESTYTLEAGAFTSIISQEDANLKAQTFFDSEKQNWVNENGSCFIPLNINSSLPNEEGTGTLDLMYGEPGEEVNLEFELTAISSPSPEEGFIDGRGISFDSNANVPYIDEIRYTRTSTVTLDENGALTSSYAIDKGLKCTVSILSRENTELQIADIDNTIIERP